MLSGQTDAEYEVLSRHTGAVHCCYVHVCFVQVTTCGAPDALTRLGARIFLLLPISPSWITEQLSVGKCAHRGRQRIGSAKQVSKLSLGQNKHGRNIRTPSWDNLQWFDNELWVDYRDIFLFISLMY